MRFLNHARNHAGLPVVAVDDVGPVVELVQHFDDSFLEVSETFAVIQIAVERISFEIATVLNKEVSHFAHGLGIDRYRHFTVVDVYRIGSTVCQILKILFCNFL